MTSKILALLLSLFAAEAALAQSYDVVDVTLPSIGATPVAVKAAPGPMLWLNCSSQNVASVYLQIFDVASPPTPGTTTPILQVIVPPSQSTGPVAPQSGGRSYYASNELYVAATTTSGGAVGPSTPLRCDFGIR